MVDRKNKHVDDIDELPPNYIWCPVCGVKCFEKNLNRHNATVRCKENGHRIQSLIERAQYISKKVTNLTEATNNVNPVPGSR